MYRKVFILLLLKTVRASVNLRREEWNKGTFERDTGKVHDVTASDLGTLEVELEEVVQELAELELKRTQSTGSSFASTPIPVGTGVYYSRAISESDICRGFKINVDKGEDPLRQHVFDCDDAVENIRIGFSKVTEHVLESASDMQYLTEMDAEISMSYGLFSGSLGASWEKSTQSTKHSISYVYRGRYVTYAKKIDHRNDLDYRDSSVIDMSEDDVVSKYGSKYIDQIFYGSQIDFVFSVTSNREINTEEVGGEIKAGIRKGFFSAGFEAKLKNSMQGTHEALSIKIDAKVVGMTDFPAPVGLDTIKKVQEYIDSFNTKYTAKVRSESEDDIADVSDEVIKQYTPVAISIASFEHLLPESELSSGDLALFQTKMRKMAEILQFVDFTLAQLSATKKELEGKYNSRYEQNEILPPYMDAYDEMVNKLQEKQQECLTFRSLCVSDVLVSDPPEKYPSSDKEEKALEALLGYGYIANPTLVDGGKSWNGYYYDGYGVLNSSGNMKPILEGRLYLIQPHLLMAEGRSPQEIVQKMMFPSWPADFKWSYRGKISGMNCLHIKESTQYFDDNYLCWYGDDFGLEWSHAGPIKNKKCTMIKETSTTYWNDNYLCVPKYSPYNFLWNSAGQIGGVECIQFYEPAVNSWTDNYLCGEKVEVLHNDTHFCNAQ